ncbi:MAG: YfhO family protein [Bacteroidales bacterium]
MLKTLVPHISAIIFFLVLSLTYFPDVLENERIAQHDNLTFAGMSEEINNYREETGKEPLWTNSMFGGMPAYLISTQFKGNIISTLRHAFQLGPRPVSFVFLYLVGFYILLIALRVNPWLAIVGSVAFAFSSYNFSIIAAGHNSKVIAIGYMAPVIAGVLLTFRGRRLLGMAITGFVLSLQLFAGHPQITYYTLIMVFIFGLFHLYYAFREKYFRELVICVGILAIGAVLSVASNAGRLWTTWEYGQYSMRSPSELVLEAGDQTGGLTRSYVTQWSYGVDETFTLLIPGFKGGSSVGALSENSETYRLFVRNNPAQAAEVIQRLPLYWGEQVSTLGPFYAGAVMVFLFVLGMFIVDRRLKWWLFAATILSIMLAWGRNFMSLTDFFLDYIPGYNKFRTVTMTMVIADLAIPLLGILAIHKVFTGNIPRKKLDTALKWSAGITGGLTLLFVLFPDIAGDFVAPGDQSYQPQLAEALQADRRSMLRTDALRSFIFIVLTAGLILLYRMKKLKLNLAILILGVLVLADMWPVNKRFLNSDHFSSRREASQPFTPTVADQFIMNNRGLNERVLNLTVSPFQDASTSYFHHSIGGYHGAKMRRYQDLTETALSEDINMLIRGLRTQNMDSVYRSLAEVNVLNMLNTKYIILDPENQPLVNQYAMGNAWFVNEIKVVEDATEDIYTLRDIHIRTTCTLDKRYADQIDRYAYPLDTTARIDLAAYDLNRLVYNSHTSLEQFAVFSEIYYPEGWRVTVDGEQADHYRVNYVLRGMVVPAGDHEIIFEFHPRSYYAGTTISRISSIALLLLLLGAIYYRWRINKKGKALISV